MDIRVSPCGAHPIALSRAGLTLHVANCCPVSQAALGCFGVEGCSPGVLEADLSIWGGTED